MFHNSIPWKKPRDDPGLKDQSSRDSRAAFKPQQARADSTVRPSILGLVRHTKITKSPIHSRSAPNTFFVLNTATVGVRHMAMYDDYVVRSRISSVAGVIIRWQT